MSINTPAGSRGIVQTDLQDSEEKKSARREWRCA